MSSDLGFSLQLHRSQLHQMGMEVECPECGGEGYGYVEVWVDNYPNGGFLSERMSDCPACDGRGYVESSEEDYDDE